MNPTSNLPYPHTSGISPVDRSRPLPRPDEKLTVSGYYSLINNSEWRLGIWRDESECSKAIQDYPEIYKPEDWFPESKSRVPPQVRVVCNECIVRLECLAYAIWTNQPDGIWAGHPAKTIRKLQKRIRQ